MLKKTINYTNADGHPAQEDVYFNLTKAELVKMALREGEGFQDYLNRIVQSGDGKAIIETFERILELAYGERIAGKFSKTPGAFEAFKTTEAYSGLFMEIVTDAKKSAEFIAGLMPKELGESLQKTQNDLGISQNLQEHLDLPGSPNYERAEAGLTKDPRKMSRTELLAAYRAKNTIKDKPVSPYKNMPLEQALDLEPTEFEIWVNVNQ